MIAVLILIAVVFFLMIRARFVRMLSDRTVSQAYAPVVFITVGALLAFLTRALSGGWPL